MIRPRRPTGRTAQATTNTGQSVTDRRDFTSFHPFSRLNRLLAETGPGRSPAPDGRPILLSVGEPQRQPPPWVSEVIADGAALWSRYPPPRGTSDYTTACADWLKRRYGLPDGMIDPDRMVLPLAGTREGLFFATLALAPAASPTGSNGAGRPAVLLPNPFYHVYVGATLAAGLEPVFVPATAENGFLPDYAALPAEILERTAICVLCSPSNPQGAVAELSYLEDLVALARRYGFITFFDECYAEIYTQDPPPGALQAIEAFGGDLEGVLVFHSLSKRSSAPGLRCGFAAGDPDLIGAVDMALRVGGAGVPLPVIAAGAKLWGDEEHVLETRDFYQRNFAIAERVLGNRFGFRKPDGGFFLWLDVGDSEAACIELWRQAGIKVLPGAYLGAADATGENPGSPYLRVAMVHDAETTEAALRRMTDIL